MSRGLVELCWTKATSLNYINTPFQSDRCGCARGVWGNTEFYHQIIQSLKITFAILLSDVYE